MSDRKCDFCGEPVNNYSGNPGLWSLVFPRRDGTGVARDHHTQCVELRLIERDELKAEVERLRAALDWIAKRETAHHNAVGAVREMAKTARKALASPSNSDSDKP